MNKWDYLGQKIIVNATEDTLGVWNVLVETTIQIVRECDDLRHVTPAQVKKAIESVWTESIHGSVERTVIVSPTLTRTERVYGLVAKIKTTADVVEAGNKLDPSRHTIYFADKLSNYHSNTPGARSHAISKGDKMWIYKDVTNIKRVIPHEFGHWLGLDDRSFRVPYIENGQNKIRDVADPDNIMGNGNRGLNFEQIEAIIDTWSAPKK